MFFGPKLSPQKINVQLMFSREPPEVIEAVARFLWIQATGRMGSEALSEEELVQKIHALYKSGDSEAFMNFANEELQRIEQTNRDLETSERLLKREFKKAIWKLCVTVFLAIVAMFIYFKYFK